MAIEPFPEDRFTDQFAVAIATGLDIVRHCGVVIGACPSAGTIASAVIISSKELLDGVANAVTIVVDGDRIVTTIAVGDVQHNYIKKVVLIIADGEQPGCNHDVAMGDCYEVKEDA